MKSKIFTFLGVFFIVTLFVVDFATNNIQYLHEKDEEIKILQKEITELRDQLQNSERPRGGFETEFVPRPSVTLSEEDPTGFPLRYSKYLRLTSPKGIRYSPFSGKLVNHPAIDMCSTRNAEILSMGDGKVIGLWLPKGKFKGKLYSGHPTRGGYMEIDHGNYISTYSHMSMVTIYRIGNKVRKGQVIGRTGDQGLATGDHLHLEVINKETGEYEDPLEFFDQLIEVDNRNRIKFIEEIQIGGNERDQGQIKMEPSPS